MKRILTLLLLLTSSLLYSQATLTDLNLVFDILASNNVTSSTFEVEGAVFHSTTEYSGLDVQVGDLVYFQDGPTTYSLPIQSITTQNYSYIKVVLVDESSTVSYVPTGRAAVVSVSDPNLLPVPPDGIPQDLATGILNDLRLKIQIGVNNAEEITDYIGSVDTPPAYSASLHSGETWRNSVGQLFYSNGTQWLTDKEILLTNTSLLNQPSSIYKLGIDTSGVNDVLYVSNNNIFKKLEVGGTLTGEVITVADTTQLDTVHRVQFYQYPILAGGERILTWNDTDGTLEFGMKGGNVTQQIGQELPVLVKHADNAGLENGKVVYIAGSDGSNKTVRYAQSNVEATSAGTFGVMTESSTGGNKAFCTTFGLVRNINTSNLTEGKVVWLSADTAGAMTAVRPIAPKHGVMVGFCIRKHATQGIIFVEVQNGYELNELHDVHTPNPTDNQVLTWNSTNSRWEAETLPDISSTNEIQTLSVASNTVSLSSGGGSVNFAAGGINAIHTVGSTITITGTEVDGSITNEIQDLSLSGQTLSLSSDPTSVTLPVIGITAGTGISTSSTSGNFTVTNTGDLSNTNELQQIDTFRVNGANLELSLQNDNQSVRTVPLSSIVTSGGGLTGNGVVNYLSQYNSTSTLDTTGIIWVGGRMGIGTNAPTDQLHTTGSVRLQNYPNTLNSTGNPVNVLSTSSTGVVESHPASDLLANTGGCAMPVNASFGGIASGAIEITLPNLVTGYAWISFEVDVLTTTTTIQSQKFKINIYCDLAEGGTPTIFNQSTVYVVGGQPRYTSNVRLGRAGNNIKVWIDELNTNWNSLVVKVHDVSIEKVTSGTQVNPASICSGWSISLESTSFDVVQQTRSITYQPSRLSAKVDNPANLDFLIDEKQWLGGNYIGTFTGAIQINLPDSTLIPSASTDIKMHFSIYFTASSVANIRRVDVLTSYNYVTRGWGSSHVTTTDGAWNNLTFRFGREGTVPVIYIGELNSSFTGFGIALRGLVTFDVQDAQHNALVQYPWSATTETAAFSNVNSTRTITATSSGAIPFTSTLGYRFNDNLFWDNTNSRLGVGNTTPLARLQVSGSSALSADRAVLVTDNASTPLNLFEIRNNGDIYFNDYPNTLNTTGNPVNVLSTGADGVLQSHPISEVISSGGAITSILGGTGISVSTVSGTSTITNTAPDQTVSITGAGINTVTGTYPNFTITGTEVDGSTTNELQTLSAGTNSLTLSNGGGTVTVDTDPTNDVTGSGASGQVSYWSGTQTQTGSSSLIYNDTQKSLTLTNSTQSGTPRGWLMQQTTGDGAGNLFIMQKSRAGAITSGTTIGVWDAEGFDGSAYQKSSRITFTSSGTIGAGAVPGTISFVTANSSGTLTTRTTLDHLGVFNHLGSAAIGASFAPAANLHVRGSGSTSSTWTAQFHNSAGNNNALMIRDDGNIGIGTNAPSSTFDVLGNVEFQNPTTAYDGGVIGSELLTTGTGTGWTGSDYTTGYTHSDTNFTNVLTSVFTPANGTIYRVVVTCSGRTVGTATVTFGGKTVTTFTSNTTVTLDDITTSTAALVVTPSKTFNGTITASVKLISVSSAQFIGKNSSGTTVYEERLSSTNIFQGVNAGRYNTTGTFNIFQGQDAGRSNTIGINNIFQGGNAGLSNTTGNNNIFQGINTGRSNTSGFTNIFQGQNAGYSNTTGSENIFQGFNAGYLNTSGYNNIFQGKNAGYANTTGYFNVFQGSDVGKSNTTGNNNIFQGTIAGQSNTTGSNNLFQGTIAGGSNTTGSFNIFQGNGAAASNRIGSNNVVIGYIAGRYVSYGTNVPNHRLSNSILIGYDARTLDSLQTNQIVIGYEGRGLGNNTTRIGNSSTVQTHLDGRLTVGNTLYDVNTAARIVGLTNTASTYALVVTNSTAGTNTTSAPALVVTNDQKVGIGLYNPNYKLDVLSAAFRIGETFENTGLRTPNTLKTGEMVVPPFGTGKDVIVFRMVTNNTTNTLSFGGGTSIYDSPTAITFWTGATTTTTGTEKMRITSAGSVGIGNTDPQRTLQVTGEARITDLTTDTPTKIVGADADGDLGEISLGSGLSITSGVLNTSSTLNTGSGTAGQVTFWNGTNSITGDNTFTWNNTNGLIVGGIQYNGYGTSLSTTGVGFSTAGSNRTLTMQSGNNNNASDVTGISINSGTLINRTASTSFRGTTFTGQLQSGTTNLTSFTALYSSYNPKYALTTFIGYDYDPLFTVDPTNHYAALFRSGLVGIGLSAPTARLHVVGTSTASGTNALLVQNVTPTTLFSVENNGVINIANSGADIRPVSVSGSVDLTGPAILFNSTKEVNSNDRGNYIFDGNTMQPTSGFYNIVSILRPFWPSSGSAQYRGLSITPNINQTGTATGSTRGILISPTLTSAPNWRSIEWSNNIGYGLYGSGTAPNLLNGILSVPSSLDAIPSLTFNGDLNSGIYSTGDGVVGIEGNNLYGLQVEPTATNIALRSEEFDNTTSWINLGAPIITRTANVVTAPDGTLTADRFLSNSNSNYGVRQTIPSMLLNTPYTFSVWMRADSACVVSIDVDDFGSRLCSLTTQWQKFSTSVTSRNVTGYKFVDITFANNMLNKTFYIWGGQLEQSTAPSSYIKTTTEAVTRQEGVTTFGTNVYGNINTKRISAMTDQPLSIFSNNLERITLLQNGNVGIGSTAPARTLHVTGEVRITDLSTDTPTKLVGADADGDLDDVVLGEGLTLSSGVLDVSSSAAVLASEVVIEGSTATTIDLDVSGNVKTIDGGNATFVYPSNLARLSVYKNGVRLTRSGSPSPARDFTVNTTTNEITFSTPLVSTDRIVIVKL